ncbi:MAG: hypothetical protein GY941_23635 [Planctomycetes bacterium]|nr:hypothetical protein [Planctomycetota bacterium]
MKIYNVWNKTTSIFFESRKDAEEFASSYGLACGLQVAGVQVISSSKQPSNQVVEHEQAFQCADYKPCCNSGSPDCDSDCAGYTPVG